jgi:methionine--tRNA ligase beta chain
MSITYDEFSKIELKVGKVLTAEKVEGSEKLLKLEVDFGQEKRQIISGIAKVYTPEQIINMSLVFITNLEPRMIMGLESNGMLLAAEGPVVLIPDKEVPPGTGIK